MQIHSHVSAKPCLFFTLLHGSSMSISGQPSKAQNENHMSNPQGGVKSISQYLKLSRNLSPLLNHVLICMGAQTS